MSEELEIDSSLQPEPEPEPEPVAEAVAELPAEEAAPEEDAEAEPEPAPAPERKHTGAVAELIENRKALKAEREARQQLQSQLRRVEEDMREGRLFRQAPKPREEVQQDALAGVAKRLNLYTQDAAGNRVPDLEAAGRVDGYIREAVREQVAPVQQMTLHDKAMANVRTALEYADANGYDVDAIRDTYAEVLQQANGAQMLSQPEVATTVWHQAVGRAVAAGKLPRQRQAATGTEPTTKPRTPAAIVTESGGRRAPSVAALKLAPALAKVYKDHGIDPEKTQLSTYKTDRNGDIELE